MIDLVPLLERQIRSIADRPRPTLIFPEGKDPRIIEAASALSGVANVVLVASKEEARALIEAGQATIQGSLRRFLNSVRFVVPAQEEALCAELFDTFWEMSHGKRWAVSYETARALIQEPVMFACMAVRCGHADAVLGGAVHASRDFFRPALRLLHTDLAAFEVGLFSLPDSHGAGIYDQNLVAFADVAINTDPDPQTLAQIAVGACKIVRDLVPTDILPQVNGAMLSYSTRGSGEGASVERVREAAKYLPDMLRELTAENPLYGTIRIAPELQISCAISIAAAKSKLHDALQDPTSPVGRANVLIVPSLDAGNLLYHLYATRYPDAQRVLMVGGMNGRVLDFSRSCTAQDVTLGGLATVLRHKRRADFRGTDKSTFFPRHRVLVLNPGSTSTKLAVYEGTHTVLEAEASHSRDELSGCATVYDQLPLRREMIARTLAAANIEVSSLDAIVGRGGLVRPVASGTYPVTAAMLDDLKEARFGEHASNLGPALAHALAAPHGIPAFTVDPVVTDELSPVSRVVGLAGYERRAVWHALSQKAVAKRFADDTLRDYDTLNLIVAHVGGGVTVGCHAGGRCFYVNDGLNEGPMTAERAGAVPHCVLFDLAYERKLSLREVKRRLVGEGGLFSHLGTTDLREVEALIEAGDERAALVFEALVQGVAAEIAAGVPRFGGAPVDAILLTGGMARSSRLVARLNTLLATLPIPLHVFPGELEKEALRDGALRVLNGHEQPLAY